MKSRSRSRVRSSVISGAVLLGLVAGLAPVASAASAPRKLSSLQQGMNYYRGKTVTFVSPDSPGGGFYQYASDYAPYLGTYLHATFNIESIPAGNTVAGQDAVAAAPPNGLTVGWLNAGPDIEDTVLGLAGLAFNPIREAWLGNTIAATAIIASLTTPACSAWTSWKAAIANSSPSNLVTEPIQTAGSTTFDLVLANDVFGVHAKLIPGYVSSAALLQGWERGDGCVIIDPVSAIAPIIKAGLARPLLLSNPLQTSNGYYSLLSGVPTVAQAEKLFAKDIKTPLQKVGAVAVLQAVTTPRGFFVNGATPPAEVAALRAAFKWASDNASLRAELALQGNTPGYQTGQAGKANYEVFLAAAKRVIAWLQPLK